VRPRRADAVRNRERVLEAARAAFADEGFDAQIPDIARRAGVGVGTVYRHFPTKDALVEALVEYHWVRLYEIAEEELANRGADAWGAFVRCIRRSAALSVADRGLTEAFSAKRHLPEWGASFARLRIASGALLAAAREDGQARPDASVDDISSMMCGFSGVLAMQRSGAPVDADRYLTLMLDGLRAR